MSTSPSPTGPIGERGIVENPIEPGRMGGTMLVGDMPGEAESPVPSRRAPLSPGNSLGVRGFSGGLSAHRVLRDYSPDPGGRPKASTSASGTRQAQSWKAGCHAALTEDHPKPITMGRAGRDGPPRRLLSATQTCFGGSHHGYVSL
jgi:hypothetical protein